MDPDPSHQAFNTPAAGQMAIQGIGQGRHRKAPAPASSKWGGAHGPATECCGRQGQTSHREGIGDGFSGGNMRAEDTSTRAPRWMRAHGASILSNPTSHRGIFHPPVEEPDRMPPASVIHALPFLPRGPVALASASRIPRLRLVGGSGIGAFTGILAQLPTFFDGQVMPGGTFFLPFALIS